MDEIRLRLTMQQEIRDCCVQIFTEIWLFPNILEQAITLGGQSRQNTGREEEADCVYSNDTVGLKVITLIF